MTRRAAPAVAAAVMIAAFVFADDDNLSYWLSRARPATQPPTSQPTSGPADTTIPPGRSDALPGVVELSDGTRLAGGIWTTRNAPWKVWVESEKRWRLVPPAAVLSMTAVVVDQRMQPQWRWRETGVLEKVYTGRTYPWRRLQWRLRLADGTAITGDIKGQPIWVRTAERTVGPMILHQRQKGPVGTTPADLVYVRRVIISRRLMQAVRAQQAKKTAK